MTVENDPWMMTVEVASAGNGMVKDGPVDWIAKKTEIMAGLDILAEFRALGVRFVREGFNATGWAPCHAIDREDENPSAAVNSKGLYVDRGNGGVHTDLIDFAVKFGSFGQWTDSLKHYSEKAGVEVGRIGKKSGGRILETTYAYRDSEGEVCYGVFRYKTEKGGKTFTQHPPDGRGGWKYGPGCMDKVTPIPYRLPEIIGSEETIVVCEGEKDADRLATLGLISTTSHGGAANATKTWEVFDLAPFVGRDIIILPDNDDAGRLYAQIIARKLHGLARSVKVIALPEIPVKGDVSDWLDLGHSIEELGYLSHAAPLFDPTEAEILVDDPTTRDATLADVRKDMTGDQFLWPGWIAKDVLTLLAAEGGCGKTRFILDLIRRMYNGLPWPDEAAPPIFASDPKFLIVAADNHHRQLCEIATEYGIPDDAILTNSFANDPFGGTSLETAEDLADMEARIARIKPVLVIIDTITNTSDLKSQDSSDAKRQYKPLQEIASRQKTPILCVTHLNAGGKVLGRRATEKVRIVIQMETPDPEGQPHRRKLWVSKSYGMKPDPLGVTMGDNGNDYDTSPPEAPTEGQRFNGATQGKIPAKTLECMDWLAKRLAIGQARVSTLRTEAEIQDYAVTVLYRAKKELGIEETTEDSRKWWKVKDDALNGNAALVNGHGEDVPF